MDGTSARLTAQSILAILSTLGGFLFQFQAIHCLQVEILVNIIG